MKQGRLPKTTAALILSLTPGRQVGDFVSVMIREELSNTTRIYQMGSPGYASAFSNSKCHTVTPERWFGIEYSEVTL